MNNKNHVACSKAVDWSPTNNKVLCSQLSSAVVQYDHQGFSNVVEAFIKCIIV